VGETGLVQLKLDHRKVSLLFEKYQPLIHSYTFVAQLKVSIAKH
jgi:hypothetical protein